MPATWHSDKKCNRSILFTEALSALKPITTIAGACLLKHCRKGFNRKFSVKTQNFKIFAFFWGAAFYPANLSLMFRITILDGKIEIISAGALYFAFAQAQDPHFHNFFISINLKPAFTGQVWRPVEASRKSQGPMAFYSKAYVTTKVLPWIFSIMKKTGCLKVMCLRTWFSGLNVKVLIRHWGIKLRLGILKLP